MTSLVTRHSLGSKLLQLNCWVLGEDPNRIFPVMIERTASVGALKDAIKDEKRPAFDHIPADALVLWKVSVLARREDLEEDVKKLNLDNKHSLWPVVKLSLLFSDQPVDDHLHIVVKAPTGEPTETFRLDV